MTLVTIIKLIGTVNRCLLGAFLQRTRPPSMREYFPRRHDRQGKMNGDEKDSASQGRLVTAEKKKHSAARQNKASTLMVGWR